MSDPVEAEKLAKDPRFAQFYNQVTSNEDMGDIQQNISSQSTGSSLLGSIMSLDSLKALALKLIP